MIHIPIIHWIADFIVQTRWQVNNKSKNNKVLLAHTTTYSLCWLVFMPWYGFWNTIIFIAITFVTHTIIDYFTSRGTAYCWSKIVEAKEELIEREKELKEGPKHSWEKLVDKEFKIFQENKMDELKAQAASYKGWFWGIIGFDQALHFIQLILTHNFVK